MWQWDFGDGTVSNDQNPMHGYLSVGEFIVCMTASDGICTNTVCKTIVVDIFESIEEELGIEAVEIYPNPTNNFFHLDMELTSPKKVSWEIYHVSGKLILVSNEELSVNYSDKISVSQFPSGMYLMKINVGEGEIFRKVLIQ